MKIPVCVIWCLLLCSSLYGQEARFVSVKRNVRLMGCQFEITVVAQDEEIGYINIDEAVAEIKRIEELISSWDPNSETSLINRNAGIAPVKVSDELFKLIERAIQISEITEGAFDISFAALSSIWKFDGSMDRLPGDHEIQNALSLVGYHKIRLNSEENTVFLKDKGMQINLGALGKGYAADRAKELLVSKLVPAGMINAAGDITTWGTKATGEKWLFGVINPLENDKMVTWLPIVESSVATTGLHERYVTLNGMKYSHIIDPKSGYPAIGIGKVTVLAKSAEFSDAMATAIYVLGIDRGLALVNQLGDTEAIIEDNYGKLYSSKGVLLDTD